MNKDIIDYLKLSPLNSEPYADKREPVEQRIYRILSRTKFRSAPISKDTVESIQKHIHTQVASNKPIIIVYAIGGGRGIDTNNFPKADWGEYLHLKFLTESLYPIGEIYEPGVEVVWSLDDYGARIINNYKEQWQKEYIAGFDTMLEYFNTVSGVEINHTRIPTSTWHKDFDALKEKVLSDAKSLASTLEAKKLVTNWGKRAINNYYNVDKLSGNALKQAVEYSAIVNMAWLDYDFEVREEYFNSGVPIAHFTAFPDCFYIQTVPGTNIQFWKANGYLEYKNGSYRSRLASRDAWKEHISDIKFIDNPLISVLPLLDKLPVLRFA